MTQLIKKEAGYAIIEATIVFPVMFLVLFFIIYIGNVFYEQARIDSIVSKAAIKGAQCVTNPYLYEMIENQQVGPSSKDIQPYRYVFGKMTEIEAKIQSELEDEINHSGVRFFANMEPILQNDSVKFNNYILYSTFSVNVEYEIKLPLTILGIKLPALRLSSQAEVAVNDTVEFIRNVDMVVDMVHGTALADKVASVFKKVNTFIQQFADK